jgi:hypothetical protein
MIFCAPLRQAVPEPLAWVSAYRPCSGQSPPPPADQVLIAV